MFDLDPIRAIVIIKKHKDLKNFIINLFRMVPYD